MQSQYPANIEAIPLKSKVAKTSVADVGGHRQYAELCSIALALDVVGDRWALLIVRDLFAGPKRFTDLEAGLPGVGTSVLSERLKQLEGHAVVRRRRLGSPAPAWIYELTEWGRALEPVVSGLGRWGTVLLAGRGDLARRGRWLLQAMAATVTAPPGVETTNFILDGEECHIAVVGERLAARDGLREDSRITVRGAVLDFYALVTSAKLPAAVSRRFVVEGDRTSAERLLNHLVSGARRAGSTGRPNT